jgi:hypothetical protein
MEKLEIITDTNDSLKPIKIRIYIPETKSIVCYN